MFDGATYHAADDYERLSSQLERVKALMYDGEWRTLPQIQAIVGGSEAGISARLRDLRKSRFGGFLVNRRRLGDASRGVWSYQVVESRYPYIFDEAGQAAFL